MKQAFVMSLSASESCISLTDSECASQTLLVPTPLTIDYWYSSAIDMATPGPSDTANA
jgi:hypothetical protein